MDVQKVIAGQPNPARLKFNKIDMFQPKLVLTHYTTRLTHPLCYKT